MIVSLSPHSPDRIIAIQASGGADVGPNVGVIDSAFIHVTSLHTLAGLTTWTGPPLSRTRSRCCGSRINSKSRPGGKNTARLNYSTTRAVNRYIHGTALSTRMLFVSTTLPFELGTEDKKQEQ